MQTRQVMAVSGSSGASEALVLQGDDALFDALVSGAHVENAAAIANVSPRTAYRRLADPEFRLRVETARQSIRDTILTRLTEAAGDAISSLWELVHHEDPEIQLKASKALLDKLVKFQSQAPKTATTVKYSVEQTQSE